MTFTALCASDSLDGIDDILVPQHDQVLDDGPPDLSTDYSASDRVRALASQQQTLHLRGKLLGPIWVALRNLTDKGDQVAEQVIGF